MSSGIYALFWEEQDLIYIGQSLNIDKRLNHHKYCLQKNIHCNYKVQQAYNNYASPQHLILEETEDITKLDTLEKYWIEEFNSISKGLNISSVEGTEYGSYKYSNISILLAFRLLSNTTQNIADISEKLLLNISTIRAINSGQNYVWLKYKYPKHYNKMIAQRNSRFKNSKSIYSKGIFYKVKSPENIEYTVYNISEFTKRFNLNLGNFSSMLYGKFKECKGWRLSSTILTKKLIILKSPTGINTTIDNISSFCKENNLDTGSISKLISGIYKSSKGWTLVGIEEKIV